MYNWFSAAFQTQNGGRRWAVGVTSCPPMSAQRSPRDRPYQWRRRAAASAYSARSVSRLRQIVTDVPVVPLVCTRHMRRGRQPSARNASGWPRTASLSSRGQFARSSQEERSPSRRRACHSAR